jgi:hypothetical protein
MSTGRSAAGRGIYAYAHFFVALIQEADFVSAQAASIIAQEAGCLVTGGRDSAHDGVVDETILTGRKYLVVRAVSDSLVRCLLPFIGDRLH